MFSDNSLGLIERLEVLLPGIIEISTTKAIIVKKPPVVEVSYCSV